MYINVLPERKCCVSMVLSGSYWGERGGAPCDITQGEIGANINTSPPQVNDTPWCDASQIWMTLVWDNLCLLILILSCWLEIIQTLLQWCYITLMVNFTRWAGPPVRAVLWISGRRSSPSLLHCLCVSCQSDNTRSAFIPSLSLSSLETSNDWPE